MTITKHEPWECPRCKTINAPWLSQCTCKPVEKHISEIIDCEVLKENNDAMTAIQKCQSDDDHKWECIGTSTAGDTYMCTKCGTMRQYLHDGTIMKV